MSVLNINVITKNLSALTIPWEGWTPVSRLSIHFITKNLSLVSGLNINVITANLSALNVPCEV